jgi:hypothetical protein
VRLLGDRGGEATVSVTLMAVERIVLGLLYDPIMAEIR